MAPRPLLALAAACASLAFGACATSPSDNDFGGGAGDSGAAGGDGSTGPGADASDGGTGDARSHADAPGDGSGPGRDGGGAIDGVALDGGDGSAALETGAHDGASLDTGATDTGLADSGAADTGTGMGSDGSTTGVLTGGPCVSGAAGATALRITWVDAGGQAMVQYDVEGLPDRSKDMAGAYGYQIGFSPSYVDPYLAQGGVGLDDSDFIDLQMTTAGISSIASATLSIYGRSYDTTASGSFNWQTFDGTGATAVDFVSNVAPYQWYSADMTSEIGPGESNVLVRIKAGPSSDALVVNQVELCMVAN